MGRLTEKDEQGNWRLKGLPWKNIYQGAEITQETSELLYGALCKLKEYEDTELNPEQIYEMDRLYREKCEEVAALEKQVNNGK